MTHRRKEKDENSSIMLHDAQLPQGDANETNVIN